MTATLLEFKKIPRKKLAEVALLTLHRPETANAFNAAMIEELTENLQTVSQRQGCRVLILKGTGKNFCAGADLHWMKASAQLSYEENVIDATHLLAMYEKLSNLSMPTVAVVQGAVFGGAVGLAAACDYVLAVENTKFCLSEVKIGLIPAVILPYVSQKVSYGQLRRLALSGQVFSAHDALQFGLVQQVVSAEKLNEHLSEEVNHLLNCSPEAQARLKLLLKDLRKENFAQNKVTARAIAEIRTSPTGQAGLNAYLTKQSPPWSVEITKEFFA